MKILILILIILSLIIPNIAATILPNESIDNYKIRYQEEFKPPQTVCGDGLCEGTEFETCSIDCKNQSQISQETKKDIYQSSAKKNIWFEISLFVVIVVSAATFIIHYIFKFRKKRTEIIQTEVWDELGVSKNYFLKVEAYIKKQIDIGFQSDAVKKALIDAGHNAEVINKLFDYVIKK